VLPSRAPAAIPIAGTNAHSTSLLRLGSFCNGLHGSGNIHQVEEPFAIAAISSGFWCESCTPWCASDISPGDMSQDIDRSSAAFRAAIRNQKSASWPIQPSWSSSPYLWMTDDRDGDRRPTLPSGQLAARLGGWLQRRSCRMGWAFQEPARSQRGDPRDVAERLALRGLYDTVTQQDSRREALCVGTFRHRRHRVPGMNRRRVRFQLA
jgi:hypothetical protein